MTSELFLLILMTSGGMPSFPGALLHASESMAFSSSSKEGGLSSSFMVGSLLMLFTAASATVLRQKYNSWQCSAHFFICSFLSVIIAPDVDFSGAVLFTVGPNTICMPLYIARALPKSAANWMSSLRFSQ